MQENTLRPLFHLDVGRPQRTLPTLGHTLAIACLLASVSLLSGCLDGTKSPPDDRPDDAPHLAEFEECDWIFPDGNPIPCTDALDQSDGQDERPEDGRCVWEKDLGERGWFVLERTPDARFSLSYDFELLGPQGRIVGTIQVETENGVETQAFALDAGAGTVSIGSLQGRHREFHIGSHEVDYTLDHNGTLQDSSDERHRILQYPWQEFFFVGWRIEVEGAEHHFLHTRETAHFGEEGYAPQDHGISGADFQATFRGRPFFGGSAGYSVADLDLLDAEESPLCGA